MKRPTLPENEPDRLRELRALRILDTPPERRFDRIVSLTKQVLDVPIAYIALIDKDRQWFKASEGMEKIQTPRDESFCGHTILQDDPLIVSDAREDERFHDNPMVVGEPYVRFYAGHPLRGEQGHNVATLCVVDVRPREMTAAQVDIFRGLAELAEHELQLVDAIARQQQLIDARAELARMQRRLRDELNEAEAFVEAQLPPRWLGDEGRGVRADYRFISSSQLGGDMFGYHDLPDEKGKDGCEWCERFAFFLLDVTGHGVGAALLSVAVGKALSSPGLLEADLANPGDVMRALNRAFPFERNNDKFFTVWYGVYERTSRTLRYAAGGHHPAVAVSRDGELRNLGTPNVIIGIDPATEYESEQTQIEPGTSVLLFSDGVFEVRNGDNQMLGLDAFSRIVADTTHNGGDDDRRLDKLCDHALGWHGSDEFDDDVSLLEVRFD